MPLLSVAEARARVWAEVLARGPLGVESVGLGEALGRALAVPVVAGEPLPGFDDSAMDGYAGRAAELTAGAELPVAFAVPAGQAPPPLPPGTVARIFTGAALPPGADTVLMQEHATRLGPDRLRVDQAPTPGANVRPQGSDVAPGRAVLSAGRVLRSGDVGLLAALGVATVAVHRRPVVAVLGSGDELVPLTAAPLPVGRRRDSNAWQLAAAAREAGAEVRLLPPAPDRPEAALAAVAEALAGADVLVTSGGVSVGDHDHLAAALRAVSGAALSLHRVALKPGKPFAFGHLQTDLVTGRRGALLFGLPGNPVSAGVTFELFVRPALRALAGHSRPFRRAAPVRLSAPLAAGGDRETWLRGAWAAGPGGTAAGDRWVDLGRSQSSGALSSLGGADCLVRVPVGAPARPAGAWAWALPLDAEDPVAAFEPADGAPEPPG